MPRESRHFNEKQRKRTKRAEQVITLCTQTTQTEHNVYVYNIKRETLYQILKGTNK